MNQPQTFLGRRGETKIEGVKYKQLYELIQKKLGYYHPDTCDPDAFCQEVCCQVEQIMGIYPNVNPVTRIKSNYWEKIKSLLGRMGSYE